jgi:four helix bundle protein
VSESRREEGAQRGFEDLECYQLALQVLREVYAAVKQLPPEEKYNLADQMCRAAVSVLLNIAEGYGRYHYRDSLRFYHMARGSLNEVLSGFIACHEIGYFSALLPAQRELCHAALRSLNGYIRYVRKQQQGRQEYGDHMLREESPAYAITLDLQEEP